MRGFLISNSTVIATVIAFGELLLMILLFANFAKTRCPLSLLTTVITAALTYDAAILAFGSRFSAELLLTLSRVRFVSHGALIPLILPICAYALHFDGRLLRIVLGVTALFCAAGAVSGFSQVLELREFAGIVRYASADTTPFWAAKFNRLLSFGSVIPLMIAGVIVMIREKKPYLFLSGLLMFVFAALGPITGNADLIFLISMGGELLMALFYLIYVWTTHTIPEDAKP